MTEGREMWSTLMKRKPHRLLKALLTAIADDDALLLYTYGNFAGISELLDERRTFRLFSTGRNGKITLKRYEKEILAKLNAARHGRVQESLKKTAHHTPEGRH